MSGRRNALAALTIVVLCAAAILMSGIWGPASRQWSASPRIVRASSAEELYRIWKDAGIRGLRIVNISSFINYREPDVFIRETMALPDGKAPYRDTAKLIDTSADHTNYLWLAQESGIGRRIEHIVPEAGFVQKVDYARTVPGVKASDNTIELSDYGTPRVITTQHTGGSEPVILNIDASYLDSASMEEFLSVIQSGSLQPTIITLYFAEDSPDVTEKGREALRSVESTIRMVFSGKLGDSE